MTQLPGTSFEFLEGYLSAVGAITEYGPGRDVLCLAMVGQSVFGWAHVYSYVYEYMYIRIVIHLYICAYICVLVVSTSQFSCRRRVLVGALQMDGLEGPCRIRWTLCLPRSLSLSPSSPWPGSVPCHDKTLWTDL